jgi:hypothetical protein
MVGRAVGLPAKRQMRENLVRDAFPRQIPGGDLLKARKEEVSEPHHYQLATRQIRNVT